MSGNSGKIRPVGEIYTNYKERAFLAPELGKQGTGSGRKCRYCLCNIQVNPGTDHFSLSLEALIVQNLCQENKLQGKTESQAELESFSLLTLPSYSQRELLILTVSFPRRGPCPFRRDFPLGRCVPEWFCVRSFSWWERTSWGWGWLLSQFHWLEEQRTLTHLPSPPPLLVPGAACLFPAGQSYHGPLQPARRPQSTAPSGRPSQHPQLQRSVCHSSKDSESASGLLEDRAWNQSRASAEFYRLLLLLFFKFWSSLTEKGLQL